MATIKQLETEITDLRKELSDMKLSLWEQNNPPAAQIGDFVKGSTLPSENLPNHLERGIITDVFRKMWSNNLIIWWYRIVNTKGKERTLTDVKKIRMLWHR